MENSNDAAINFFSKFDNEEEILVDFSDSSPEPKEVPKEEPKEVINPEETKVDTPKEAKSNSEDNIPFHKHPRWQEKLKENKELKAKQSQWEKERQELQERLEKLENKPLTDEDLE
jgi:hypothetical protein